MVQVAMLKKAERQFVHPSREAIEKASSWTMRPPRKTDSKAPSSLQVLLKGQFYIYQAVESRVKKVNEVRGLEHKVGAGQFFVCTQVLFYRWTGAMVFRSSGTTISSERTPPNHL